MVLTDHCVSEVFDKVRPQLAEGDFASALKTMVEDYMYVYNITDRPFRIGFKLLHCLHMYGEEYLLYTIHIYVYIIIFNKGNSIWIFLSILNHSYI